MKNILVADDEPRMRKLVHDFLKREGYNVIEAKDGKEAIELFYENGKIDMVILDVMMPEFDGWAVCRKIKRSSSVPVIMLTARDDESDELFGFELGADEYIKKPFSPKILVARVNARMRKEATVTEVTKIGELEINETSRIISLSGKNIDFAPKEYELLLYLIRNKGIALSREKILNEVWDYNFFGDERTVDTHIKKIRAKLENMEECIQTVRSYGYKFEVVK